MSEISMNLQEQIAFCEEKSKNIKLKTEPQTFVNIKANLEKLEKIEKGKSDFEELERIMCRYFNMVDILKEKTELEKLALDIVCKGMQTMGCLNGILES